MNPPSENVRRVYLMALSGFSEEEISIRLDEPLEEVHRWLKEAEAWARSIGPTAPPGG